MTRDVSKITNLFLGYILCHTRPTRVSRSKITDVFLRINPVLLSTHEGKSMDMAMKTSSEWHTLCVVCSSSGEGEGLLVFNIH